jgi:hypothetical protein
MRNAPTPSRKLFWTGAVISGLMGLLFIASAAAKVLVPPDPRLNDMGLSVSMLVPLAILEALCAVIYLVPRTSVLGAILLTGYMGGAIMTHWRVGDPFIVQLALGVLVWLGVYLREPRLWPLLPWRRSAA